MFFDGHSYPVIFAETGLPTAVFLKHKRSWERVRQETLNKLIESRLKIGTLKEIEDIRALSLTGLKEYLSQLVLSGQRMTPKDAKLLSDIIANIDRIARLEGGKPTDIKRYETMTPEELRQEARSIIEELKEEDPVVDYTCH